MSPEAEIKDGASYYEAFLEMLAAGDDDKLIARKMSCSRGEVKRRRSYFAKQGILKDDAVDEAGLKTWLASDAGQKAQQKWEEQEHKKQNQKQGNAAFQQQGYKRPELKQAWRPRKV